MLTELLTLIADGNLHTTSELATALGIGRELVEQMVADLARHGYLAPVTVTCSTHCAACSLNGYCQPTTLASSNLFALTSHMLPTNEHSG
jgi:hypothetical protein